MLTPVGDVTVPVSHEHAEVVIDFSHLPPDTPLQDLKPLLRVLRSCRLVPMAMRGASAAWMQAALALGLVEAPVDASRRQSLSCCTMTGRERPCQAKGRPAKRRPTTLCRADRGKKALDLAAQLL